MRLPAVVSEFFGRLRKDAGHVKPGPLSQDDRLSIVQGQVDDAKQAAEQERTDWTTWREFYDGEGQQVEKAAPGAAKDKDLRDDFVVSNFVKTSLQTYIATLMQVFPAWYVVAHDKEQDEAARTTTDYLQAYATVKHVPGQYQMALEDALVVGTGAVKTYWDPARNDVVVRAIDPQTVLPDPTATALERCEYLALRNVYGAGFAKRLWPELDFEKAADVKTPDYDEVDQQTGGAQRVEVIEFYYDFGERLMVYSGEQVLFDKPNPMPNNRYPVFLFQMPHSVRKFWATGLVADMMDLQNLINRTRSRIAIYQRYMTNPSWVCDSPGAREDINVGPGEISYLPPGHTLAAQRPPPLPADVFRTIELAQQALDIITGVHDVMRGIRPEGVTAGIAMEGLRQTAQIRMTGPSREWNYGLADLGQGVLDLMQQHYSEDRRVLPILDGPEPKRVEIAANELSRGVVTAELEESGELDDLGQPVMQPKTTTEGFGYYVITQPGGDLPLSQASLAELSLQLRQLDSIDDIALLDALHYPGRDKVMQRKMIQAEGEAAGAAQAQAGQQAQVQGEQAEARLAQLEQHLTEMLTPEQMQALRFVAVGEPDEEFALQFFESLPDDEQRLAMDYAQLARQLQAQGQPEPDMQLV